MSKRSLSQLGRNHLSLLFAVGLVAHGRARSQARSVSAVVLVGIAYVVVLLGIARAVVVLLGLASMVILVGFACAVVVLLGLACAVILVGFACAVVVGHDLHVIVINTIVIGEGQCVTVSVVLVRGAAATGSIVKNVTQNHA